ncbi:Hypothetical predicted protein [Mytilus galloprovincialis]|uniref:Uncharacterized protein n=1 Tax=Mytilus galloprovincialis TaxID=29158 RepID=A0A8B6BWJ9_MYTGA|nr:Hypothetical predicted protein [Mytilus galloprovincialis]
MVIDALLLCFVADVDDNDGTDGRPYYASDKLRKYIEETIIYRCNFIFYILTEIHRRDQYRVESLD